MPLADGYTDVPRGKLVNVVTCLEMRAEAGKRGATPPPGASLRRLRQAEYATYRELFTRVGAPYLWYSRLTCSDDELRTLLANPDVQAYAVAHDGSDEGILELNFAYSECELRFIGVTERLIGKGFGRWLIDSAIGIAFSRPIDRFWLHTCNFDHPSALGLYIRCGFAPYKRQIEVSDDPRQIGLLPRDAAPEIPII